MGVPQLYQYLARRYPNAFRSLPNAARMQQGSGAGGRSHCSGLYIDFNSVVHGCVRLVANAWDAGDAGNASDAGDATATFEARVIAECLVHVDYLTDVFRPSEFVFLAVDGVPPMGKMHQQRSRRYVAVHREPETGMGQWDANAITPGTAFMAALGAALHTYSASAAPCRHIIVSDASEPGEGEQKIFRHIRHVRHVRPTHGPFDHTFSKSLVVGMDADLMLMAMVAAAEADAEAEAEAEAAGTLGETQGSRGTVVVARELEPRGRIQLVDGALLAAGVSADVDRACHGPAAAPSTPGGHRGRTDIHGPFDQPFSKRLDIHGPFDKPFSKRFEDVAEYVALLALAGNDFLPGLPGLLIRDGGIDALLRVHGEAIRRWNAQGQGQGRQRRLTTGGPDSLGGLDPGVLCSVVERLSAYEDVVLRDAEREQARAIAAEAAAARLARDRAPRPSRGAPVLLDEKYPISPGPGSEAALADAAHIRAGVPGWRARYYHRLFCSGDDAPPSHELVDAIAVEYLAAVAWSSAYLGCCPSGPSGTDIPNIPGIRCLSQGWHYPHAYAPTALDLHHALTADPATLAARVGALYALGDAEHRVNRTCSPALPDDIWQLVLVLPPQSAALIPPAFPLARRVVSGDLRGCAHMYPRTFPIRTYLRGRLHECAPALPPVDRLLQPFLPPDGRAGGWCGSR